MSVGGHGRIELSVIAKTAYSHHIYRERVPDLMVDRPGRGIVSNIQSQDEPRTGCKESRGTIRSVPTRVIFRTTYVLGSMVCQSIRPETQKGSSWTSETHPQMQRWGHSIAWQIVVPHLH